MEMNEFGVEEGTGFAGRRDAAGDQQLCQHRGNPRGSCQGRGFLGMRVGEKRLDVVADRSHPVGVTYPISGALARPGKKAPSVRDLAMVDPRIRLFGGKIGCGTCHDFYSTIPKFLVLDTRGGRLCRACHTM